jgi:hypothetical protein
VATDPAAHPRDELTGDHLTSVTAETVPPAGSALTSR